MARYIRNNVHSWSTKAINQLMELARVTGFRLRRKHRASKEGIALKPANQSPYSGRARWDRFGAFD